MCKKQFSNYVIKKLCELKIDTKAEVFRIFLMFCYFNKGIILS
jgi:hypothetical protein